MKETEFKKVATATSEGVGDMNCIGTFVCAGNGRSCSSAIFYGQ
jgi:hypothetical protein